jgi:hypothetical protein
VPTDRPLGEVLRAMRWGAVGWYFIALVVVWWHHGIPFDREGLLLWIAIGLGCFCIGRHPVWLLWVAIDFLPFALVLVAYDRLRGWSDQAGMPTWWHPQLNVDKWLFFGHEPTVWLQEHLKRASYNPFTQRWTNVQWYDVLVCITYFSFFFLPYVMAGAMWLRSRTDFYRWSLRFVSLSFVAFGLFLLIPSAPPWAAALCTSTDVADHPNYPACMQYPAHAVRNNLLGDYHTHIAGAHPYVERIAGAGWSNLHISQAHTLWAKGFSVADPVAAVPSLHVGGTVLFCIFMWPRLSRGWRFLLIGYPIVMMFSLTYAGEHYVADGIAGALCAFLVHWTANRIERWHRARREQAAPRAPDTLEAVAETTLESECPPISPLQETTPSST